MQTLRSTRRRNGPIRPRLVPREYRPDRFLAPRRGLGAQMVGAQTVLLSAHPGRHFQGRSQTALDNFLRFR